MPDIPRFRGVPQVGTVATPATVPPEGLKTWSQIRFLLLHNSWAFSEGVSQSIQVTLSKYLPGATVYLRDFKKRKKESG